MAGEATSVADDICLADLGGPADDELVDDVDIDFVALFADTDQADIAAKAEAYLAVLPLVERLDAERTVRGPKSAPKARGRALWLADVLRAAGLRVIEVDDWQTRGADGLNPLWQVWHHTASAAGRNAPSLTICIKGRPDLRGPLCNLLVARDGTIYVVASGIANHAGSGDWPTPGEHVVGGNRESIGWECENNGLGEPWNAAQVLAICIGMAAICRHTGRGADTVVGHKEFARPRGRKPDPRGIDMDPQRQAIAQLLTNPDLGGTDVASAAFIAAAHFTDSLFHEHGGRAADPGGLVSWAGQFAAADEKDFAAVYLRCVDAIRAEDPADQHSPSIQGIDRNLKAVIRALRERVLPAVVPGISRQDIDKVLESRP